MRQTIAAAAAASALLAAGCVRAGEDRPALEHIPAGASIETAVRSVGSGLPFSAAVRAGDVLYMSGQIGTRADGSLAEGMEAQSRQTMDNIAAILARAGLGWNHVFRCLVMLDDMSQWAAFNRVYVSYFSPGSLPARSALGADGLALGALVEVECQAYAPAPAR